jgi:sterol desaturase/sphingolipid hydroxylase (fatty acid hydroxylase superfamily)
MTGRPDNEKEKEDRSMALERILTEYGEPLQYLIYFGLLACLGLVEAVAPRAASPAARARRWPVNFGLTALNVVVLGALPVSGLAVAVIAEQRGWGLLNRYALPFAAVLAVALLARSLVSYGVHVAMHKVPALWRVHRVHHTDVFLDVSTTVRFHPLEFLIQLGPTAAVIMGLGLPPWTIMLYELLDTAANLFIHANARVPAYLDRWLRRVVVTPDMHRVHHSALWPATDSNYGVLVPWWDQLFGTYRPPSRQVRQSPVGLIECQDRRATSLPWLLALPFRRRLERLGDGA